MKIPYHSSEQLAYARRRAKLTKLQVGKAVGIDPRRLQEYESNKRRLGVEHARALELFFGIRLRTVSTGRRSYFLESVQKVDGTHFPTIERPFRVRLGALRRRYPNRVKSLEGQIAERSDLNALLDVLMFVPLDSSLELLVVLELLASGGTLGFTRPGRHGYFGPRIIDPQNFGNIVNMRRPALRTDRRLWFPQVSLDLHRVIRVDFLVCCPTSRGPDWVVVEIDGEGHRADDSRENLSFRIIRVGLADLESPQLLHRLNERLASIGRSSLRRAV